MFTGVVPVGNSTSPFLLVFSSRARCQHHHTATGDLGGNDVKRIVGGITGQVVWDIMVGIMEPFCSMFLLLASKVQNADSLCLDMQVVAKKHGGSKFWSSVS